MNDSTILQTILRKKHTEVAIARSLRSISSLEAEMPPAAEIRPFAAALKGQVDRGRAAVIAEIKKASPSKGLIRADFDPVSLAKDYAAGGATCLSILTDEHFFQGANAFLQQARSACELPVLRKDFMVDPYQIVESRWLGADCILLIVAALDRQNLIDLSQQARALGMDVLVEVHNEAELEVGLALNTNLIGINNRNLHNFVTDLDTTYRLLPLIPPGALVITESGINSRADILALQEHGVWAYLIGETFMRSEQPGKKLAQLVFGHDYSE